MGHYHNQAMWMAGIEAAEYEAKSPNNKALGYFSYDAYQYRKRQLTEERARKISIEDIYKPNYKIEIID